MKKTWLVAFTLLAVVLALVITKEQRPPVVLSSAGLSSTLSIQAASTPAAPAQSSGYNTQLAQTLPQLEVAFNQPVSIEHGGALRDLVLAKDELYVRNADGVGRVVSFPPASSAADLLQQWQKKQKETGSAPELVLYPPGAPRNDSTRRIVTRDILIEADSRSAADALAGTSALGFKSAPVYAPGKYIYEAPSSPEALAFFVKTADSASPYVTPLLASKVAKMTMPNDPLVQKQWHLKFQNQLGAVSGTDMNVEPVWKYPSTTKFNSSNPTSGYIRGNGVAIGIVDDGMEWSHPDLSPNVLRNLQKDWNGKDFDPKPYFYDDNHGTSVAGVAAARGNNRIGVSGVAPEANLVGMRLIAGPQTDSEIAEAMTWELEQIHIKNNSWGYGPDTLIASDVLTEEALEYAAKYGRGGKGSILTFAAGNYDEYQDRLDYKGINNSMYTLAVAAVDSFGVKAYYSNPGAGLVISAPSNGGGLGIMTTDNKGPKGYNYGVHNTFFMDPADDFKGSADLTQNFGGTSSACPAISGVVALMIQRNPNLGWRDLKEILMRTAVQVDATDSDWISANRTDHVTGNATIPFHFNHKYGAGLVDAAAAVALSGNWTNLPPQKNLSVSDNSTQAIAANATVNRTFTVSGNLTRAEHVTLQTTITDIPKGNLTITLTSPGNTTSTFCLPHSDEYNTFIDWKFMSVRNWAENPNGNWTLTVTNNGSTTGTLTNTTLTVYGTSNPSSSATSVTLAASTILAPLSSNVTLNATATALAANGTVSGNITGVQFFRTLNGTTTLIGNGTMSGNSSNPATYTCIWNTANLTAGNYSITANATSSANVTATSNALAIKLDPILVAGWDFQTLTSNKSTVPLTTVLMSARTYNANFGNGSGTLLFNGANGSSQWSYANGEIFASYGSSLNAAAGFATSTSNPAALMLRAGKNLGANGKNLIFRCASTANKTYTISYAASATGGGFPTHAWSWSNNATGNYTSMGNATLTSYFSTFTFSTTNATSNGTLYLRLTPSGATSASGTNLIDNFQIQSN